MAGWLGWAGLGWLAGWLVELAWSSIGFSTRLKAIVIK
jgi:hypothetical protein